ncbi:HAD-IIIC family phosphatase [Longispora sp. NPDC051575]|uniref:HAD-IIIC family phosphatase n=1 Tax=Longispora sp. NPDC051575 TaxID=3154943 RepID=UPI003433EC5B
MKCVVWDLDGTVWPGVAIEGPENQLPTPFPWVLAALAALEARGVVNSVASRTDPTLAAALAAHPDLADRFVAPQLGWGDKSEAIGRIAAALGIAVDAVAFVDDNPFERAEVAALLPGVLVLSPEELRERFEDLFPEATTDEARRRPDRYREEQRRLAAEQDFAGSRDEFLRSCGMVLTVSGASPADVPRIAELVARTHRFNTTGEQWSADQLSALVDDPDWFVPVARLADRFGEYGQISTALVQRGPSWRLRLFMVSCRAAGREVPVALLGWLVDRARADGARELLVEIRTDLANLELRMLLRRVGFEAVPGEGPTAGGALLLRRDLTEIPPVAHLTLEEKE